MQHPAPTTASFHRSIWALALPAMLANLATALFGVADLWVIGRLGDAQAQGAVELGAKLLVGVLGVFNFLRTGTVALTAQALGRQDENGQRAVLLRGLATAMLLACVLLALRSPVVDFALRMFSAEAGVDAQARVYINLRYWALPAWLACAVLTGWLIGHQRVRAIFLLEVGVNALHVLLDLAFVLVLHWGVAGVAVATLLSEWLRLLILIALALGRGGAPALLVSARIRETWRPAAWFALLRMNRDLFIRTLLLTASIWMLTRGGAVAGADTLAANGIIFLLFSVATLILDGFEIPAQVLCGQALGARRRAQFSRVVAATAAWGMLGGVLLGLVFLIVGKPLAASFSTDPGVIAMTAHYAIWLAILPAAGALSFVMDGVFIGAGWTRAMLLTMAASFAGYALALYALQPLGNHGLWLAYTVLLLLRAGGQLLVLKGLVHKTFAPRPAAA